MDFLIRFFQSFQKRVGRFHIERKNFHYKNFPLSGKRFSGCPIRQIVAVVHAKQPESPMRKVGMRFRFFSESMALAVSS